MVLHMSLVGGVHAVNWCDPPVFSHWACCRPYHAMVQRHICQLFQQNVCEAAQFGRPIRPRWIVPNTLSFSVLSFLVCPFFGFVLGMPAWWQYLVRHFSIAKTGRICTDLALSPSIAIQQKAADTWLSAHSCDLFSTHCSIVWCSICIQTSLETCMFPFLLHVMTWVLHVHLHVDQCHHLHLNRHNLQRCLL